MRNLDFVGGSYHVGLLCETTDRKGRKMALSLSGWPYDTIASASQLSRLFVGKFTVAFPDPALVPQIQTRNRGMRCILRIDGSEFGPGKVDAAVFTMFGESLRKSGLVAQDSRGSWSRSSCTIGQWVGACVESVFQTDTWDVSTVLDAIER